MVTIAYWDTEGGSRPPRLLGDYRGTPTIRLFKPKRKQRRKGSSEEKEVVDYQHGERNLKDMRKFLEYQLPNFAEKLKEGKPDLDKAQAKAEKYGLPVAVLFTTKASTSTTVKWLSVEVRRRMLLVEVPPTEKNRGLREKLLGDGAKDGEGNLPSLHVIPPASSSSGIQTYDGTSFSRRKLQDFLEKHALKKPVLEPIVPVATDSEETKGQATETDGEEPPKKAQSVVGDEF